MEHETSVNVCHLNNLQIFNYILINNTNHTFNYYNFRTKYAFNNPHSDANLVTYKTETNKWLALTNYNKQYRVDEFEDEFEERTTFLPSLVTLRQSSIANFFTTNMIDIPRCLKKSYSLYKPIFQLPHLKFLNILMRHGRKEQILASVFKIFVLNRLNKVNGVNNSMNSITWITLLPILSNVSLSSDNLYRTFYYDKLKIEVLDKTIESNYLIHPQNLELSTFLNTNLEKYKPIFMFKVQKVDKKTRKNSRGKSGKYLILWKYVPVYRRIYAVLRWLIQDISFQKSYKFQTRFLRAVDTILNTPDKSVMYKCRNFNHNYVFKNFKKTLLKNLKTVS